MRQIGIRRAWAFVHPVFEEPGMEGFRHELQRFEKGRFGLRVSVPRHLTKREARGLALKVRKALGSEVITCSFFLFRRFSGSHVWISFSTVNAEKLETIIAGYESVVNRQGRGK